MAHRTTAAEVLAAIDEAKGRNVSNSTHYRTYRPRWCSLLVFRMRKFFRITALFMIERG